MRLKSFLLISLIFTSLFWPLLFGLGLSLGIASLVAGADEEEVIDDYTYHWGNEEAETQVLSIPITGPILDERPEQFGSFDPFITTFATFGVEVKELLYEVSEDKTIDGVILEINSPGGTVTGSKAIADGIAYYKEKTGKPVYTFASGVIASGSYWAGISADRVVVETGSLVGSIGVIGGQFPTYTNVSELNQGVIGPGVTAESIDVVSITAGEGKDFGNPFRPPTEKELDIAQESTNLIYDVFTQYVSQRRSIDQSFIVEEVGAYVYSEEQARNLGLIDEVGNREKTYSEIATQLGSNSLKVVRKFNEVSLWDSIFGVFTDIKQLSSKKTPISCIYRTQVMAYMGNVNDLCQ